MLLTMFLLMLKYKRATAKLSKFTFFFNGKHWIKRVQANYSKGCAKNYFAMYADLGLHPATPNSISQICK